MVTVPLVASTQTTPAPGPAVRAAGFHALGQGPQAAGEVCVADISLDEAWGDALGLSDLFEIDPRAIEAMFPRRLPDAHKGTSGHVLVIGGSAERSGAVVLAV